MSYTVHEVARMAGVSVRTLHHYDDIGLLEPSGRSEAGYRLYDEGDLFRLQQILFYRELELPLAAIRDELSRPDFDPVIALAGHRRLLQEKAERIARLLSTIDKTIARLGGGECMLTNEELYEGFTREEAERFEREAGERWGQTEAYAESKRRVARMTKGEWAAVRAEGEEIDSLLAGAMRSGLGPTSPEVAALIGRKVGYLRHFYEPTAEIVEGLGAMYAGHPDFRSRYEALAPGLADFLKAAMAAYAAKVMRR
jgi:DNA-binding transcriptional MerR regulator